MDRNNKMFKNRAEITWVCSYQIVFIFFLILSYVSQIQCQIIRKSIELPVRDYLSSPKTDRNSRDGRDQLYVLGGNLDSVRTFEVLSPHTPASALMFAGLGKNNVKVTPSSLTPLTSNPRVSNKGGIKEIKNPKSFSPESNFKTINLKSNGKNVHGKNLISRSADPSSKHLKDGLNVVKKGYSFSFTAPSSDNNDIRGSHGSAQEFLPTYTTPFPSLSSNNDAAFGYFNKFPLPLPIAREGIAGYNIEPFEDNTQYSTPVPTQFTTFNHEKNIQIYPSQTPAYYPTAAYYPEKDLIDYYQQTTGTTLYPSGVESGQNNEEKFDTLINYQEYKEPSANEDRSINSPGDKQLPTIPPTIGVIGWKSNTDLNTNWKPNNALMDMANKQIKQDLKHEGYDKEADNDANNKDESGPQEHHQEAGDEEASEEEEENKNTGENIQTENEEDEEEDGQEEQSEEEEEEEEEGNKEGGHEEEENTEPQNGGDYRPDTYYRPAQYYENSAENSHNPEYNNEGQDKPYLGTGYYYDGQTLPPGPPYEPPPSKVDERTKYGYLPPPSVTLGAIPYESFSGGVHQTWTPITPEPETQTIKGNMFVPQYKSEKGRWLLNGGPILGSRFSEVDDLRFDNWEEFGKDKSRNHLRSGEIDTPKEETNSENPEQYDQGNNINTSSEDAYFGKKMIKSEGLPVQYSSKTEPKEVTASEEREYSDESSKESESNYEPPPPPIDHDEQRERTRVSDHEFPRKVPTRLRYPGGGLWAKPAPDSGIELGFVPQKVYTQTRRHNTVKHLPREAAFAAASTAEDVINAPRLREVVSHKKTQEVYEEEGYEDTGYDHGGYKKHGQQEENRQKHDSGEDTAITDWEEPEEEESFKEHVAHLEAVPESGQSDASGQSSAKQQVVQTSENPKVKGSWKQQKTITNEKSMAYLDGEGKGGILTQRHLPKTEGVIGKVLEIEGKRVPIYREISYTPEKLLHRGAVSHHSSENKNAGPEIPVVYSNDEDETVKTASPDFNNQYDDSSLTLEDPSSQYDQGLGDTIITKQQVFNNYKTQKEQPGQFPQLSSYVSRNNKFSYVPSKGEDHRKNGSLKENIVRQHSSKDATGNRDIYTTTGHSYDTEQPQLHDDSRLFEAVTPFIHGINTGASSYTLPQHDDIDHRPTIAEYSETSQIPTKSFLLQSPWNYEPREAGLSSNLSPSPKKERKSRDLTAFGVDRFAGVDTEGSDFTQPTAEIKAIEETTSSLSSDVITRPTRSRQISIDTSSTRKYTEIVRNSTANRQESAESTQSRGNNVRLAKDDLNIRHPFLPRDEKGDVKIDYIQTRTRVQDSKLLRRRHHYREDTPEPFSTTEELTTTSTTTEKVTTVKSIPSTTTEYVPEDPSETLKRLRNNVFLASIFKGQGNIEDKQDFQLDSQTTTTPKVTTYRAKLKSTTESVDSQNSPSDAIERLKTNPFLTGVFSHESKESSTAEVPQKRRRGSSRIRPIVVPDDISADSSVKHVEQLTLAQYSGPSNGMLYKEVPIVVQQRMTNLAQHLNTRGVDAMHIVVRRSTDDSESHVPSSDNNRDNVPVDVEKYPFYLAPETVSISKHSPMRYASNPKDIPIKTDGGMEFYESRDKAVRCEEPSPPKDIVPKRKKDGEWNKNTQPDKQRLGKLGDQIDCLKLKYFGEDPLDNPFFKETDVGVPNLSTESPDDKFGFYSQIKSNIESDNGNNDAFFKNNHRKRHIISHGEFQRENSISNILNVENFNKATTESEILTKKTVVKDRPSLETAVDENEVNIRKSTSENTTVSQQNVANQNTTRNSNFDEDKMIKMSKPPSNMSSGLYDMPRSLHPPKNVIISLKSKGTSNHPKIRYNSEVSPPHDMHIMIVPMGSIGYLKTHPAYHVKSLPTLKSLPRRSKSTYKKEPLYILDPISTETSKITKIKKQPASVTYLMVDLDGHLIHQHIRTFIPVRNIHSGGALPESNMTTTLWEMSDTDERRGEPRYRVKRNNENDKYVNSKDSLELKNFLLKKYADILAKEKSESKSTGTTEQSISRNVISSTTSRTSVNKRRPPYSSRYSAVDPMHGSSSTDVETSRDANSSESSRPFPIRKPALRFPKLAVPKLVSVSDASSKTKLMNSDPPPPRVITVTTTTTTTEPPPSTTTRMYKPRVVYKKEYGKPLERVVNMFAVLNRQPTDASVQTSTISSTTEYIPTEPRSNLRRQRPQRLQQFEHRTITKEEVFRRTYDPEDEIKERSDRVDDYDSLYDHPDIRGPVSRISRETEEQHEVLVYMVNPTTGIGEWKYMQVPSSKISRMDQSTSTEGVITKKSGKRKKSRAQTFSSDQEDIPEGRRKLDQTSAQASEDDYTTINPKKQRSKPRRKSNHLYNRNRMHVKGSRLRGTPALTSTPVVDESASLDDATTPISPTPDEPTTEPTSTLHPKVIVEPHKRKYFYAKV